MEAALDPSRAIIVKARKSMEDATGEGDSSACDQSFPCNVECMVRKLLYVCTYSTTVIFQFFIRFGFQVP
jgi:hypothetical protein